jgi:hypothetical protein
MNLTLEELKEKLIEQVDEVILLELLSLTSEDIVDRFEDIIELKYETLIQEVV